MKSIFICSAPIILLALLSMNSKANAAMYVYPMEASVGMNGASKIRVISQDNDVQFIRVSLKQVLNPGTKEESEKATLADNPAGLIITPRKIALSSASERVVRLVSVEPPQKETTWRAYFESVNENNFLDEGFKSKKDNKTANVGVNIVWGALIHVAPKKVIASLKINRENGKVFNDGTIRMPVKEIGECHPDGQCLWKKTIATVYPDTEIDIPQMTFSHSKTYRIKYINWITKKMEEAPLSASQTN
ncbi:fimbrial protein [Cedecea davisae]|uniref:fimbrial protein n=1 Tax=Cedecea davisae TaxID=158484 RepID=UPI00376EDB61